MTSVPATQRSTFASILKLMKIFAQRTMRIPMTILFALIIPMVLLIAIMNGNQGKLAPAVYNQVSFGLLSGLSLMSILVLTLVSIPNYFVTARETNLLKQVEFSHISLGTFLTSLYLCGLIIVFLAESLVCLAAHHLFHVPLSGGQFVNLFVSTLVSYTFYFLLGLLVANRVRSTEQVQSSLAPLYFGILFASGAFVQFSEMTGTLGHVLRDYNPFYILMNTLNVSRTLLDKATDPKTLFLLLCIVILGVLLRKHLKMA